MPLQMRTSSKLKNMSTEEIFNAAVNVINSLPKNGYFQPSNELKLKFYSYFKQATEGPNRTSKPAFYDIIGVYKWEAWKKLGNMSKEEAMNNYIESLQKIVETMSYSDQIKDFYETLGPFYEENEQAKKVGKLNNDDHSSSDEETVAANAKAKVNINEDINEKSESNMNSDNSFVKVNGVTNGDNSDGESEADEFSDTLDHIGSDTSNGYQEHEEVITARGEADLNSIRINQNTLSNRASTSRVNLNRALPTSSSSTFSSNANGASGSGGSENPRFNRETTAAASDVQQDITLAILRLQQSLHQISSRLHSIETKISDKDALVTPSSASTPAWKDYWPFSICPRTMAVLLAWPFIAAIIVNKIRDRNNRRT